MHIFQDSQASIRCLPSFHPCPSASSKSLGSLISRGGVAKPCCSRSSRLLSIAYRQAHYEGQGALRSVKRLVDTSLKSRYNSCSTLDFHSRIRACNHRSGLLLSNPHDATAVHVTADFPAWWRFWSLLLLRRDLGNRPSAGA